MKKMRGELRLIKNVVYNDKKSLNREYYIESNRSFVIISTI